MEKGIHPKCAKCKPARCCQYISLEIDTPTTKKDFNDIYWYLAHRNVSVYINNKKWFINFDSPCGFLNKDNLCSVYEKRPLICREYDPTDCPDGEDGYDFAREFKSASEFLKYLEVERKIKLFR